MEDSLTDSIFQICKVLNNHSVEYLIVGGTAVALHGYFRYSRHTSGEIAEKHDLDFWYNSNYDNYFRLLNALEELGQDISRFKVEKSPNPKSRFSDWTTRNLPLIFYRNYQAFQNFIAHTANARFQK